MMTMSFLAFEIGLVIAFFSFFVLLIPSWVGIDWELFFERFFEGALPPLVYKAWWLLVAGVVILLHPFYVGAGFGVYLNRRTRLEGWDLEIAFKRLSQRLSQRMTQGPAQQSDQRLATPQTESSPGRSPSRTGAVLGVFFLVLLGGPMLAEGASVPDEESVAVEEVEETARAEAPWDGDPEDDPRRLMAEVMELPELAQRENVERWRFRWNLFDWLEGAEDTSSERNLFMEVLALLVGILIRFSEPLMWLGALCLLFILLRTAWRYLPDPDHLGRESQPVPELLFGLDLRPESLPNDIPETAQELWRKGQTTAALSLLYRGALARLGAEGVVLRESFTEDDCVRSARKEVTGERADFFAELTRTWQQVAYAHRLPEVETVGRLWNCWGEHFGGEDLGAIQ